MKIGNLLLFTPMHSNGELTGDWVIAAWHWKNSITWRWSLVWQRNNWRIKLYTQDNMWKKLLLPQSIKK